MISTYSGERLAASCTFYDNPNNTVSVWLLVANGKLGLLKTLLDFLLALMVFLSPLMTIYFMIFNFYSDISVRSLIRSPDATVIRQLSDMYYVLFRYYLHCSYYFLISSNLGEINGPRSRTPQNSRSSSRWLSRAVQGRRLRRHSSHPVSKWAFGPHGRRDARYSKLEQRRLRRPLQEEMLLLTVEERYSPLLLHLALPVFFRLRIYSINAIFPLSFFEIRPTIFLAF